MSEKNIIIIPMGMVFKEKKEKEVKRQKRMEMKESLWLQSLNFSDWSHKLVKNQENNCLILIGFKVRE